MKTYAWDNMGVGWNEVFGVRNPYRIGPLSRFAPVLGVRLAQDEKIVRSSRESIDRTVYGVFDSPLPIKLGFRSKASRPKWTHELTTGEYDSPAVVVSVPLRRAAGMKNKMRVGVMVCPKEPFTAAGKQHWRRVDETINLIVADILCAVITNQDGIVLKTVAPGG